MQVQGETRIVNPLSGLILNKKKKIITALTFSIFDIKSLYKNFSTCVIKVPNLLYDKQSSILYGNNLIIIRFIEIY